MAVNIIGPNGGTERRETLSTTASIESEETDGEFVPSVVQQIKFDNKGQMSRITTECGESENRREADEKPKITVEGILTKDEIGPMRALKNVESFQFVSDIFSGQVIVERLSIVQSNNLLYIEKTNGDDGSGDKELAYEFQMQLKQP